MKKEERKILNQWLRKYPFLWAVNMSRWDLVHIYADRVGRFGFQALMAGRMAGGEVWAYYDTKRIGPQIAKVEVNFSDSYEGVKSTMAKLQEDLALNLVYVIFVDTTSICICKEPPEGWPATLEKFRAGMSDENRSIIMEG